MDHYFTLESVRLSSEIITHYLLLISNYIFTAHLLNLLWFIEENKASLGWIKKRIFVLKRCMPEAAGTHHVRTFFKEEPLEKEAVGRFLMRPFLYKTYFSVAF